MGGAQGSEANLCNIIKVDVDTMHLAKPIEPTMQRVSPNENYGF